jgi:predicted Zn-dependent peptidase
LLKVQIPIESETLANGLRVIISPDHSAPVVTVGVYYEIGFRLEPQGRSGFAHLFEHMMFLGSEHVGKTEHIRLVTSAGGVLNGNTHYDVTSYFQAVPSNALERILWLEADRMRGLKFDEENLRNERDVIKEEVRVSVLNRPYGSFPWLDLPPIAYRKWPNAHNFYGDFGDLDAATLDDLRQFFQAYYSPNNAVLLMVGDVDSLGLQAARRYFEDIPPRELPPPVDISEPPQHEERRGEVKEHFGHLLALAIGHHVPDRHAKDWYAAGILDGVVHGGRAGRVYRSLVLEKQIALKAGGGIHDPVGTLFDYNGPTLMVTRIFFKPEYSVDAMISAFDSVIREVQERPLSNGELEQVKAKFRGDYFSTLEAGMGSYMPHFGLMHALACFTLFDHDPQRVNHVLDGFLAVTPAEIQQLAQKILTRENRAILVRRPQDNAARL